MRTLSIIGLLVILNSAPVTLVAGENFDAGHFLQTQCSRCHDSSIYTREDRKVDSLERLDSQVRLCDANLGTKLFDEDIAAVISYLNDNYYKFLD